jgi:hypothetical protein
MKEQPESNYHLSLSPIDESTDPQLGRLLPRTYRIEVNRVVTIALLPSAPVSPWPPPYPMDWNHWQDRDEATRYLFATNAVSIAPTDSLETRIQSVIFDEYPDLAHTMFWLPKAEHEAILLDGERVYNSPFPSKLRLDDLAAGPLAEFLKRELPRASLSTYDRRILCLDPPPGT